MEVSTEEVFAVLDKLLENLGLQLEEYDFVFLTQAELYVEMFKLMFPTLVPMLNIDFSQDDVDDEELLQSLLDFLSQYIIKVDLDHISSSLITQGDPKHILNFLQLIYEISKMVIAKEGEEEEEEGAQSEPSGKVVVGEKLIKSSPNSFKQLSEHSQRSSDGEWQAAKYHTAQGIPEEFIDMIAEEEQEAAGEEGHHHHHQQVEYDAAGHAHPVAAKQGREYRKDNNVRQQQEGYDNPYRPRTDSQRESYSGSRISEVSKSKEFSDYELNTKKKSGIGRRSEEPTSEDFERLRNYEKRNQQQQHHEEGEDQDQEEEEGDEVEIEEEEEEELQDMPEDESDRYVSIREKSHHNQKIASHLEGDDIEGEEGEDEEEGEYEYVYEDEYGNLHPYVPGQEEGEDAEYYASDPIDYNSIKAKGKAQNEQVIVEHNEEEQEPEEDQEEGQEYEYQYGHEEPQSGVDESHAESEDHRLEPNYAQEHEMEAQNYYYEQQQQQPKMATKKTKGGKGKKARPQTAKTQTRPVTAQTYKKPEVQYRPLRPVTGNYVPAPAHAQQKKESAKKKVTQQSTAKKSVKKSFVQRDQSDNQSERSNTENMRPKYGHNQNYSRNSQNNSRRISRDEEQQKYARNSNISNRNPMGISYPKLRKPVKVVKPIRIKGDTLTSAFEAQQSMLYDRIRDEKLDYLKKIHKIIFQLDKKRVLEERKAYMDYRRSIDEDTIGMMLTLKQNYKDKIDGLKRGHLNDRNERKMTDLTQKMFLHTLKQELSLDQMKEIDRLRNRWSNEKLRFEMMTQDENFLEKRLVDLYKK